MWGSSGGQITFKEFLKAGQFSKQVDNYISSYIQVIHMCIVFCWLYLLLILDSGIYSVSIPLLLFTCSQGCAMILINYASIFQQHKL